MNISEQKNWPRQNLSFEVILNILDFQNNDRQILIEFWTDFVYLEAFKKWRRRRFFSWETPKFFEKSSQNVKFLKNKSKVIWLLTQHSKSRVKRLWAKKSKVKVKSQVKFQNKSKVKVKLTQSKVDLRVQMFWGFQRILLTKTEYFYGELPVSLGKLQGAS